MTVCHCLNVQLVDVEVRLEFRETKRAPWKTGGYTQGNGWAASKSDDDVRATSTFTHGERTFRPATGLWVRKQSAKTGRLRNVACRMTEVKAPLEA
jgi:hypothetical protein